MAQPFSGIKISGVSTAEASTRSGPRVDPPLSISGSTSGNGSTSGIIRRRRRVAATSSGNAITLSTSRIPSRISSASIGVGSTRGPIRLRLDAGADESSAGATSGIVRVLRRFLTPITGTGSTSGKVRTPVLRIRATSTARAATLYSPNVRGVSVSLPEDRRDSAGRRPATSLLVYAVNAISVADVTSANVPDGGSFLCSPLLVPGLGLWSLGARPGLVGTRVGPAYVFRNPLPSEIVWHIERDNLGRVAAGEFYRHAGPHWLRYDPLPLRAVRAQLQYVASQLDPDGAIDYYGKLLASVSVALGQDNLDLADITDPEQMPSRFLSVFADALGSDLEGANGDADRRRRAVNLVPQFRRKGTDAAVVAALREEGYDGFVREVWVSPDDPDVWFGRDDAPAPARDFLTARGLFNDVRVESGRKGSAYILRPHQYDNDNPSEFFPSSRVVVFINLADGQPVFTLSSVAREAIARRLRMRALPAHVDIKFFATRYPVRSETGISDEVRFRSGGGSGYTCPTSIAGGPSSYTLEMHLDGFVFMGEPVAPVDMTMTFRRYPYDPGKPSAFWDAAANRLAWWGPSESHSVGCDGGYWRVAAYTGEGYNAGYSFEFTAPADPANPYPPTSASAWTGVAVSTVEGLGPTPQMVSVSFVTAPITPSEGGGGG